MRAAAKEGKQENTRSNSKDGLFSCQRVAAAGKRSCDERHSLTKVKASELITERCARESIRSPQQNAGSLSLPEDFSDRGISQDVGGSLVAYSTNSATQETTNEKKESASETSEKKPGSARRNEDEKGIIKKPKRPMSTYNFFFKEERSLIAAALSSAKTRDEINQVLTSFGAHESELQPEQETHETLPSVKKKKKFNGTVSFEDIGKIIGRRWRSLDKKTFAKYNALAAADSTRYRVAIDKYYEEYDADRKARPHLYLPAQKEESPAAFGSKESLLSHDNIELDQNNSFSMETSARVNDSVAEDRFRSESTVASSQENPVVAIPFGDMASSGLQHLLQSIPSGYSSILQNLAETLATVQPQLQVQSVDPGRLLPSIRQQIIDLVALNSLLQTRNLPILRQQLVPLGFGLLPQQSNFANINYTLPAAIGSVPYINVPVSELAPLLQPSFQVAPQQQQQQQQSIGGVSIEALQLLLALSHANSNSNGNGTASGSSNWNLFS